MSATVQLLVAVVGSEPLQSNASLPSSATILARLVLPVPGGPMRHTCLPDRRAAMTGPSTDAGNENPWWAAIRASRSAVKAPVV